MKKQVAILLLFCYSTVLLRPLVPCISDFLAHTFWESGHLATVHFENGKYHLHVEIQKAEKELPAKSASDKQAESVSSDYFPSSETKNPFIAAFTKIDFPENRLKPDSGFISCTSPPPWSC